MLFYKDKNHPEINTSKQNIMETVESPEVGLISEKSNYYGTYVKPSDQI